MCDQSVGSHLISLSSSKLSVGTAVEIYQVTMYVTLGHFSFLMTILFLQELWLMTACEK